MPLAINVKEKYLMNKEKIENSHSDFAIEDIVG